MNIQDIKNRYKSAYIEDFGDYEIVHVDKEELDWLIEQAEKIEKLQQRLDAKIVFVSNGLEEDMYALQERVIKLEEENEQLKKDKEMLSKIISADVRIRAEINTQGSCMKCNGVIDKTRIISDKPTARIYCSKCTNYIV